MSIIADKIANPTKFYHSPREVKQDDSLTKAEKITLLINWLDDEKLKSIATEENMGAAESSDGSNVLSLERLIGYYKTH